MYVCWFCIIQWSFFYLPGELRRQHSLRNPWVLSRQRMTGSENLNETVFFFFLLLLLSSAY